MMFQTPVGLAHFRGRDASGKQQQCDSIPPVPQENNVVHACVSTVIDLITVLQQNDRSWIVSARI
jgi:hypothetical protein